MDTAFTYQGQLKLNGSTVSNSVCYFTFGLYDAASGGTLVSRVVDVSELVRGVGIALNRGVLQDCPNFDQNGDQRVTVEELVVAVRNALTSCPTAQ